ncbi:ABC transporter permease [Roseovarius sp.]|uniref:ABC transporter permease n=1 Tax=Roseovarius sp. TaxID=1486281 RepID=UPI003BAC6230
MHATNATLPPEERTAPPGADGAIFARLFRSARLYAGSFALPVLVWQLIFFVAPLCFLVAMSFWVVQSYRLVPDFDTGNWARVLGMKVFWDAYARTFAMAAGAAALISVLAFPVTCFLAFRLSPAARRLAMLMLVVPFFTSYLVRAYTWQVFLADDGIVNAALTAIGLQDLAMLNTVFGTFVGYVTLCLPLVILLQLMSVASVDRTLIEAARNLRCSPMRTVFRVVIPASRVGLTLGATFCFILVFGDFVSPTYLGGGNAPTLGILITDFTKAGNQWPRAAVVAITMIATLLTVAFLAVRFAYRKTGETA